MLIRRDFFNYFCLNILFFVALLRATNIGYGYPSAQHLLSNISYLPQKFMQIGLLMLMAVFFFFTGKRLLRHVRLGPMAQLIIAFTLLSVLFSANMSLALRYLISVSVVSIPVFLYYQYYGPEALYNGLIKFISILIVSNIAYVLAFPQYGIMDGVHSGAWRGLFVHKNGAGSFFCCGRYIFFPTLVVRI